MLSNNLAFLRKQKEFTQSEMADFIGITGNTRWSDYERGKSNPPIEILVLISDKFKISIDALIKEDFSQVRFEDLVNNTEKGSKGKVTGKVSGKVHTVLDQKNGLVSFSMPQVVTVDNFGNENMVLVPVRARAGYLSGYGDTEFISQLPSYRLPNFTNGTYRMFEVEGLSMHNTFNDKDILITKFIESLDFIKDDRIYVVVTKSEGVVVKRVLNRVKTDGKLILKSDNYKERELYPNMVISPEDVLEIWYCVAYMSRIMRAPAEMYTRVIDLEGRLTLLEANLKKGIT